MKKSIIILATLFLVVSVIPNIVFATGVDEHNVTLAEIQNMLLEYFEESSITYEPGTDAYYNYILDQLLNHSDQELIKDSNYALIHAYMVEYKNTYEEYLICVTCQYNEQIVNAITAENACITIDDESRTVQFSLAEDFLTQTIDDLKERNAKMISEQRNGSNRSVSYVYNGSSAAEYAMAYADQESYNTNYPDYRNSGGDCTNFISQCILAGGIGMNGSNSSIGIHSSTTEWYCTYISTGIFGNRRYSVSTSWIRVSDFNTYMTSVVNNKSIITTLTALHSASKIGDVVQLADKTTGTPYHSIIISGKDSSTSYFSGHSNSRNNEDIMTYLDESSDLFILFDFA